MVSISGCLTELFRVEAADMIVIELPPLLLRAAVTQVRCVVPGVGAAAGVDQHPNKLIHLAP